MHVNLGCEISKQPVRSAYQPPVNSTFFSEQTSHSNQPAVLFSRNKSAPAISHQPNEQASVQRSTRSMHMGEQQLSSDFADIPAIWMLPESFVYHSNPVGELINPFLPLSRIQTDN
jgi:hypothetical protein